MPNELTNLLPHERRRALRRSYFLRLGVVSALLVTALTGAAAALLIPTYLLLVESARAKETRLANIEATLASADEATLSARLAALSGNVALLTALSRAPSASAVLREALAVPHPGVTLWNFAYTPAAGGKKGTLAIGGISSTRGALRTYQLALQGAPFSAGADLPVSAYAMDTDSAFTITVTLAP